MPAKGRKRMSRAALPDRPEFQPPAFEAFADQRVLVVDDNSTILSMLIWMLRHEGIRVVRGAENGVEALEMHGQRRFDLILLNNKMPRLTGLGTLRELRRRRDPVPVIMHSASLQEEDVQGLGLDIAAFIDLPFSNRLYLQTVQDVLSSARRRGPVAA
jgi:two-component system, OmpR family, response regulator ChvI